MLRDELSDMIALARRLRDAGEPAVLSTLFSATGSTYRQLGSMMVSGPGTMMSGGVSGGCLEEYIARHGRSLVQARGATVLSFETDSDGDLSGMPTLGCGGSVEVLVELLTPSHLAFLKVFATATVADSAAAAAVVLDEAQREEVRVQRHWFEESGLRPTEVESLRALALATGRSQYGKVGPGRRALVHYVSPMTRLVIFGAGNDVAPLVSIARSLGWHVAVVDRRVRLATAARFPEADQVVAGDWGDVISELRVTGRTAMVLMTHSLADDIEILPLLATSPAAYVGVLGPTHRREWVLEGVAESTNLRSEFIERLRGPIGLNLGERSAAGIAVAITAEILADLHGADATRRSVALAATELGQKALVAHE